MAADISLSGGILTVEGTNDRDIVEINAGAYGGGSARISNSAGQTLDFMYFGNVTRIDVYGYNGNDHIENNTGFPSRLYGGNGNDTLLGGSADDKIYGGSDNDVMEGHDGNDYMSAWYGNDIVRGQNGDDRIYGAWGDDFLYGGAGNDFIAGWDGKDYIYGESGNDELKGGDGEDRLYGGSGNDFLRGQDGNDRLYGSIGNDILMGELGNDYLSGSSGHDSLYGGSGNDDLNGHSGNDGLFGGTGSDELNGGSGADRFLILNDQPNDSHNEVLEDISYVDAKINFQDGDARYREVANGTWYYIEGGSFNQAEVERVDASLRELHLMTGNTNFLKRSNGTELTFERLGAQTKGDFNVGGINGGGKIFLLDASFDDGEDWLAQVVIHEVGHNWDSENPEWTAWKSISGWTKTPGAGKDDYTEGTGGTGWFHKTSALFARDYGKFDPYEDFATYFTKHVMERSPWTYDDDNSGDDDPMKDQFMEDFINDMKA